MASTLPSLHRAMAFGTYQTDARTREVFAREAALVVAEWRKWG